MQNALVIGCNGTIGKELVNTLLNNRQFKTVIALLNKDTRKLKSMHLIKQIVNFKEDDQKIAEILTNITDVFICMGSNFSDDNLENANEQDYEIPLKFAKLALDKGVRQLLLLNPPLNNVSNNNYLKLRAKLQTEICKMPFTSIKIFYANGIRKSSSNENFVRLIVSNLINLITFGFWHKIRPIHANYLATAMLKVSRRKTEGIEIFTSHQIKKLA